MPIARMVPKTLLLASLLSACLAGEASAAGLAGRRGLISSYAIFTHFTSATKVVNGKTVFVEGTPMLYVSVLSNGVNYAFHSPFSGDKAKGWLDILNQAHAAGKEIVVHGSDSYQIGRTACANYVEEGCIELQPTYKYPYIQLLVGVP